MTSDQNRLTMHENNDHFGILLMLLAALYFALIALIVKLLETPL